MLAAELARHDSDEGRRWSRTLRPLDEAFAARFREFLPKATYPIRVGTHFNTAFALMLALEYADTVHDLPVRRSAARARRIAWYSADADCQAWEPSLDDFLSSALIEAECMRRVLEPGRVDGLDASLPAVPRRAGSADAVHAGDGERSHRRKDRASRRTQSQSRVVLAIDGLALARGRSAPRDRARDRGAPPRRESAARRRRLCGRALARDVRAARDPRRSSEANSNDERKSTITDSRRSETIAADAASSIRAIVILIASL